MDTISIIIPVYNVAPYIQKCLQSIQQQTYRELEIILVDDGSTDNSGQICDEFSALDRRFRVLHKENGGVSSARNAGIDLASGQYIAFVDPDDYLSHGFYENLYNAIIEQNADFAIAGIIAITESGKPTFPESVGTFNVYKTLLGKSLFYNNNNDVLEGILSNYINCLSWNKLFKRELWGKVRYPVALSLGEDLAIIPGICAKANRAIYTPDAVYYYRLREKSLLHGMVTHERLHEDLQGSEIMRQQLLSQAPEMEGKINLLKTNYDFGCCLSFIRSKKNTKEKESALYHLLNHGNYVKDGR